LVAAANVIIATYVVVIFAGTVAAVVVKLAIVA